MASKASPSPSPQFQKSTRPNTVGDAMMQVTQHRELVERELRQLKTHKDRMGDISALLASGDIERERFRIQADIDRQTDVVAAHADALRIKLREAHISLIRAIDGFGQYLSPESRVEYYITKWESVCRDIVGVDAARAERAASR